ncbi:MAG: hypothetical protein QMD03_08650 [Syntrophales bacterium]|nr:hypothetical protein [Syntrophales bacterium]
MYQNEVRADIFSGSLAVFQSERVASAGGRKGGSGGIGENSPADFPFKLEFFIFALLLQEWPKAGFLNFHF